MERGEMEKVPTWMACDRVSYKFFCMFACLTVSDTMYDIVHMYHSNS